MVCLSGRELRNTTPNVLIMFVLNTNFADPNNPTGYPSRKSVTKSEQPALKLLTTLEVLMAWLATVLKLDPKTVSPILKWLRLS